MHCCCGAHHVDIRFGVGQGFMLEQDRCITSAAYTIYIEARLDTTTGWRRIIGSDGWEDTGYVYATQFSNVNYHDKLTPSSTGPFQVLREQELPVVPCRIQPDLQGNYSSWDLLQVCCDQDGVRDCGPLP